MDRPTDGGGWMVELWSRLLLSRGSHRVNVTIWWPALLGNPFEQGRGNGYFPAVDSAPNGAFPPQSVQSAKVQHESRFHCQKWPAWPGLSRIELYSSHSTTTLRYWDPKRVPASLCYTLRPLISRQNHFLATITIITNSTRERFLDGEKLSLLKKISSVLAVSLLLC